MEAGFIYLFKKAFSAVVTKKRMIGWGSALALAVGAGAAGMSTPEFKAAVCDAPVVESAK